MFGSKSLIWSRQGGGHSAIYVGRRLRRGYGKTQICSRRNEATGIEALFDRITRNGRASKTGSSSVFGFRNQRGSYRTTLYEALEDQQLTRYVRMASGHRRPTRCGARTSTTARIFPRARPRVRKGDTSKIIVNRSTDPTASQLRSTNGGASLPYKPVGTPCNWREE